MKVISYRQLREYGERYPDADQSLRNWHAEVEKAIWNNPMDVKAWDARASILKDRRVVFNIRGNRYRLVVEIGYLRHIVYIRWFGPHAEYDKIDAGTI